MAVLFPAIEYLPFDTPLESYSTMLTVKQMAERRNCSLSKIYALVSSGQLEAYRIGKGKAGLRFDDGQIKSFLLKRKTGGASVAPPIPKEPPDDQWTDPLVHRPGC